MDNTAVLQRLRQLPSSFRRQGNDYANLEAAIAAATTRFTSASADTSAQETIKSAGVKWLDTFGMMYGVPRFTGEAASAYLARIQATLVAWRGTPVAIESYLQLISGLAVTVTESPSTYSWSAGLSGNASSTIKTRINQGVNFVRPAGVPFNFSVATGGLYASTINYAGRSRVTGAYIIASSKTILPTIAGSTNNSLPTLPTDYLTDPTINS